jgi:septal ring factor EnvC (AmiA/AmiB activator)
MTFSRYLYALVCVGALSAGTVSAVAQTSTRQPQAAQKTEPKGIVTELNDELQALDRQSKDLSTAIDNTVAALSKADIPLADASKNISDLMGQVNRMMGELANNGKIAQKTRDNIERATRELDEIGKDSSLTAAHKKDLRSQWDAIKDSLDSSRVEQEKVRTEIAELSDFLGKNSSYLARLQVAGNARVAAAQLQELTGKMKAMSDTMKKMRQRLELTPVS